MSEFIDVEHKLVCPVCGYTDTTAIGINATSEIRFRTYCGTPPHHRDVSPKNNRGCGIAIDITGSWSYQITSIKSNETHS